MAPGEKKRAYPLAGGLDRQACGGKEFWAAREKELAQTGRLDFWISKKKKGSREKGFLRDFGKEKKHTKICVGLRTIFLIL